ncbi:hypothetical protein DOTSEDRAFT_170182, partial [Dothistroma septosporum NZE10]
MEFYSPLRGNGLRRVVIIPSLDGRTKGTNTTMPYMRSYSPLRAHTYQISHRRLPPSTHCVASA